MALQLLMAFACGLLCWPALKRAFRQLLNLGTSHKDKKSQMYGLKHAILNLRTPPTMWMNLGYWKDQLENPRDFPRACQSLLEVILRSAFQQQDSKSRQSEKVCLIDVGFGCGDSSLLLLNHDCKQSGLPKVDRYIGLTNVNTQYLYAQRRLESHHEPNAENAEARHILFCEDAAAPNRWPSELKQSLRTLHRHSILQKEPIWLLALDTMYHFKPSRMPLLQYASHELNASFMAFDYILADGDKAPTTMQRLLLRLTCLLSSTPYNNFLTQKNYRKMLIKAGYDSEMIEFEDITQYVFQPLCQFLTNHDIQLRSFGLGIGAFKAAKWIFSWWARSGIVRGCVIVARHG